MQHESLLSLFVLIIVMMFGILPGFGHILGGQGLSKRIVRTEIKLLRSMVGYPITWLGQSINWLGRQIR